MNKADILMLKIVAEAMGEDLLAEVVFVGGVTTSVYIQNDPEPQTTPTEDVDLIVNITTLIDYEAFEKKIGRRGFKRDLDNPGPRCRFHLGEVVVDFMPLNLNIMGFTNRWYEDAFRQSEVLMVEALRLRILSFPYFLATKFEAFEDRGRKGLLWESKDLEDILVVLAGRLELIKDLNQLTGDISTFVKAQLTRLLKDESVFREAAVGCLYDYGPRVAAAKTSALLTELKQFLP